jgi:hypothetical protein
VLTLADIRRRARSRLDDTNLPYLWSDTELLDIINDTVRDAAIRAHLTVQDDIQIKFTQKADLTWNSKYALPSACLDVKSVRLSSQLGYTLYRTSTRRQETIFNGRPITTGKPYSYTLDTTKAGAGDDEGVYVRAIDFVATPTEADTALLDIERLPILLESDSDVPEIDEIWQTDLIYGITGLAYLKRDTDTFDPKKSERDFAIFEARFGVRLPASVIRERQTDVPLEMIVG